jgi:hypothetical protein
MLALPFPILPDWRFMWRISKAKLMLASGLLLAIAAHGEIPGAVQEKAAALNLTIVKVDVGHFAGAAYMELRNDGAKVLKAIVLKAECYDKKGILTEEFKARHDELKPGETWVAKSRVTRVRHWILTDLSATY